jgi:hypothetical protein
MLAKPDVLIVKKQLVSQSTKERQRFQTPRNSLGYARLNRKRKNSEKDQSKLSVEPSMFDSIKSENTMKAFLKKESNLILTMILFCLFIKNSS